MSATSQETSLALLDDALRSFEPGDAIAYAELGERIEALAAGLGADGSGKDPIGPRLLAAFRALRRPATELQALAYLRGLVADLCAADGAGRLGGLWLRATAKRESELSGLLARAKDVAARRLAARPSIEGPGQPGSAAAPAAPRPEPAAAPGAEAADPLPDLVEDPKLLASFYAEAGDHLTSALAALVELEEDPGDTELLDRLFRDFHTIKGSSAFLGLKNIETLAHSVEDRLSGLRSGGSTISPELVDEVLGMAHRISRLVEILREQAFDREGIRREMARASAGPPRDAAGAGPAGAADRAPGGSEEARVEAAPKAAGRSLAENLVVKVSNEKLSALVDAIGELVISLSMHKEELLVAGLPVARLPGLARVESITTAAKNLVLSMGMVPVAELFARLKVAGRVTAHDLGKPTRLEFLGEETELDRKVIEALHDPLVHVLRNAIDHGLEDSAERALKGKPPVGLVRVAARQRGSGIEICVEDDGKGIDPERLKARALALGLVPSEELEAMGDEEAMRLMFLPGFSTAAKVTNVSGRGVGLDVVRRNVTELRGRVEVQSERGRGSRFLIRLPLTLAIIDGFVARLGSGKYVFPFGAVEELLVLKRDEAFEYGAGAPLVFHRGRHVPVADGHRALGEEADTDRDEKLLALLLSLDEARFCLPVDEIFGKQEIVVKALSRLVEREHPCLSGGTIFGDGSIGFVVEMGAFFDRLRDEAAREEARE